LVVVVRRAIVVLSMILTLTGLFAVLTLPGPVRGEPLIIQDMSFSGTSHATAGQLFGPHLDIGTMSAALGTAGGPVAMSSLSALTIGTVAVNRRNDRTLRLRDRVVVEIAANPGIHLRELLRNIGCAMGALQYHLKNLEHDGVIVSVRNGNAKHFFLSDFSDNDDVLRLAAMLRNPTIRAIVLQCGAAGQVTQADLSRSLSIDKSLVSYYVNSLLSAGFLKAIRVFGREKPLTLTEGAASALQELGVVFS